MKSILSAVGLSLLLYSTITFGNVNDVEIIINKMNKYINITYTNNEDRIIAKKFIQEKRKLMLSSSDKEVSQIADVMAHDAICSVTRSDDLQAKEKKIKIDLNTEFEKLVTPELDKKLSGTWMELMRSNFKLTEKIAKKAKASGIKIEDMLRKECM